MTQRTRIALLVALVVVLVVFIGLASRTTPSQVALKNGTYTAEMQPGKRLALEISSGGIEVVGEDTANFRIEVVGDPWRDPRIGVRDVNGNMTVSISGVKNNSKVLITVPTQTDLRVNMGAGQLDVSNLNGDKDITLYAGQVNINGDAKQYRAMDAKVLAGRIAAPPMGLDKGGLFRWANWYGSGKSMIDVSVLAGEVRVNN